MEAIFLAQNKFRHARNLTKVKVERNAAYKPIGLDSYCRALHRYDITPTKPGPFCRRHQVHQRGLGAGPGAAVGGRVNIANVLVRKVDTPAAGAGQAAAAAAGDQQPGYVPAIPEQFDSMYLSPVQIGTPPQTLMLDFDTGSADLWVFSTELPKSVQGKHTLFDPTASSTYQALKGLTWNITYGDQSSASGNCGSDVVGLGGLQVNKQCIELAQKLSTQFVQSNGDGLLGLAFSKINTVQDNGRPDPQPTVVDNMIAEGDIPKDSELFTSCMYSGKDSTESFYTFGWIDQDLVQSLGGTPIDNSQGFWQFPSASASINGTVMSVRGNTAIADTGTTLALLSDNVVDALYAAIPGAKYDQQQQGYLIPKTVTLAQLPDFSVAVGDTRFIIQKEDLIFADVDDQWWYGAVQSRGSLDFDILGDAFLKSIYAIWDQGNLRFGAIAKIQKTQTLQAA